jgi:hypothetical protein
METLAEPMVMYIAWLVAVSAGELESLTENDRGPMVALLVGVPVIEPVDESERPSVSVPDCKVHVYGGRPPVAVRFALYAVPMDPEGREVVVTERRCEIVRESFLEAD